MTIERRSLPNDEVFLLEPVLFLTTERKIKVQEKLGQNKANDVVGHAARLNQHTVSKYSRLTHFFPIHPLRPKENGWLDLRVSPACFPNFVDSSSQRSGMNSSGWLQ